MYGQLDVVKYIIEKIPDLVSLLHENNNTLLIVASKYGDLELVKYLIEKCANINNVFGAVLTNASEYGHLEVVTYIVENFNVRCYLYTPLIVASKMAI